MKPILFLKPVFMETIWGGEKLRTEFGYEIQSDHVGECWAVSAHKRGDCTVLSVPEEKEITNKTLSQIYREYPELFGNRKEEQFPLLTKIIDAKDDLSIQVHPDNAYAAKEENGALGKTECWYILDCEEDAEIIIGHHAKTKEELQEMVEKGKWEELIDKRKIHPGDFFQIEPGTVHAIKKGTLLLETQQNSDITYRLYDYDRLQDGKPRELHLQKSLDVIVCPSYQIDGKPTGKKEEFEDGSVVWELVSCSCYEVWHMQIKKALTQVQEGDFTILSVIGGKGTINGIEIKKGDHMILPNQFGEYQLEGNMELIRSVPF